MKKGLMALITVTLAFVQVSNSFAEAPVIADPGDVIIGDIEDGTASNLFVFPDAINLRSIFVSDDTENSTSLKWSYFEPTGMIVINGTPSLTAPLTVLGQNDPTDPATSRRLDNAANNDDAYADDSDPLTLTFRNVTLSPEAGPNVEPGVVGIVASQTKTVSLFASDCSTYTQIDILVFTANNTTDGISGGSVTPTFVSDSDFAGTGSTLGWTGGAAFGLPGTFTSGASGLCLQVGASAPGAATAYAVETFSPQEFIALVDLRIYKVRHQMGTTQTNPDAIPLWSFTSDNFDGGTGFVSFGTDNFFVSTLGGSAGIGVLRNNFQSWIGPNSVTHGPWRGAAGTNGAFDPANASFTGIRIRYVANDANGAVQAVTDDTGTICVERTRVDSIPVNLLLGVNVFAPPIDSSTHAFDPIPGVPAGTTSIDNGTDSAEIALPGPTGTMNTDTTANQFIPNDASVATAGDPNFGRNPLKFDPATWQANSLYELQVDLRAETTDLNPIGLITLNMNVPTSEQGAVAWQSRGPTGGALFRASSPKTTTGTFRSFWFSHNVTLAVGPPLNLTNAGRFRGVLQLFNRGDLHGVGAGTDSTIIEGFRIRRITNAPLND
jgi:hypothetical protein